MQPAHIVTCIECGRAFNLLNADEADEWVVGHDCEPTEPDEDSEE